MLRFVVNSPGEAAIAIFALLAAAALFMFLSIRVTSKTVFYGYAASLFYVDYLKLAFPSLPLGFVPDVILILFIFRVGMFEQHQVRRILSSSSFRFSGGVLLGYLAINLMEIFNPILPTPLIGAQAFRGLLKIVGMYWATLIVMDSKAEMIRFIRFFCLNIFVVFLFSFKQILFGFSDYELTVYSPGTIRRIYSLMTNAAVFSIVLGIGSVKLFLDAILRKKFQGILASFAYLLVSAMSFHRAPLLATLMMLAWLVFANLRETGRFLVARVHQVLFFALAGAVVVGGLLAASLPYPYDAMKQEIITRLTKTKEGVHEPGLKIRLRQIRPAVQAIHRYPFGGGLGYTQLRFGKQMDEASVFKGLNNANIRVRLPTGTGDNTFLTVALETGWTGLFYFSVLLAWAVWTAAWNLSSSRGDADERYILSFALGAMGIIVISIFMSSTYFLTVVGSTFWMAFALSQAARQMREA